MTHALTETPRTAPKAGADNTGAQTEAGSPRAALLESIMAWLPALVILVGMPLLALTASKYVLVPKMKAIYAQENAGQDAAPIFTKIPLDGANLGAASGFRSLALICADKAAKERVNQNQAKLLSLAAGDLKGKVASDLYQPGVLNATRARLLADFDRALGGPVVKEVYIAVTP